MVGASSSVQWINLFSFVFFLISISPLTDCLLLGIDLSAAATAVESIDSKVHPKSVAVVCRYSFSTRFYYSPFISTCKLPNHPYCHTVDASGREGADVI